MRLRWVMMVAMALGLMACKRPYRVGEHVLVEWEEGRPPYPAYIVEKRGNARYRIHYEGYETVWDEDVGVDRIKGRVSGPVEPQPPPERVARAIGLNPRPSSSATPVSAYRIGDRVRVRWRGSVYSATVVAVLAPDRFLVHYDGHESAFEEVVDLDRIVTRR